MVSVTVNVPGVGHVVTNGVGRGVADCDVSGEILALDFDMVHPEAQEYVACPYTPNDIPVPHTVTVTTF